MPCETLIGMYRIVGLKKKKTPLCGGFYDYWSFPEQPAQSKNT